MLNAEWRLFAASSTTLGCHMALPEPPIFQNLVPSTFKGVTVYRCIHHPYTHPQPMSVVDYSLNMTPQCHFGSAFHQISHILPPCNVMVMVMAMEMATWMMSMAILALAMWMLQYTAIPMWIKRAAT